MPDEVDYRKPIDDDNPISSREKQCLELLGMMPVEGFMNSHFVDPRADRIAKIMIGKRPKNATEKEYELAQLYLDHAAPWRKPEFNPPQIKKPNKQPKKIKPKVKPEPKQSSDIWDSL